MAASARPSQHPSAFLSSRLDGPLPSGVRAEGDTLGFPPLTTEHSGTYVCHVSNELSSRDSQVVVDILGKHWGRDWDLGQGPCGGNRKPGREGEFKEYLFGGGWTAYILQRVWLMGWFWTCFVRAVGGDAVASWSWSGIWGLASVSGLSPADPQDTPGKQVDLVSASVVVVGVIAALLFCLLVVVVVLMSRYHRRKAQQMTQK